MNLPINRLHGFIMRAKSATYGEKGIKFPPYRPEAYKLQFKDDDFFYVDSYFGGKDLIGQETIYFSNRPIWAMNYYGRLLEPERISPADASLVIQESLSALYKEGRFLGGFSYSTPLGDYIDTSQGDLASFTGTEWITLQEQRVYELVYHGGILKN